MEIIGLFRRIYDRFFLTPEEYLRKKGVKIGTNCDIQTRFFGSEPYLISIGNHVQITSGVKFFTHGGGWIMRNDRPNFDSFGKITIGNNVYIGNNVLIMPGVTIQDDVIIGAGSVVSKSIPSGCIVAGNPIRKIGEVKDFKQRMIKFDLGTKGLSFYEKKGILLSLDDSKFILKDFLK